MQARRDQQIALALLRGHLGKGDGARRAGNVLDLHAAGQAVGLHGLLHCTGGLVPAAAGRRGAMISIRDSGLKSPPAWPPESLLPVPALPPQAAKASTAAKAAVMSNGVRMG